jgi:hypothetical protein
MFTEKISIILSISVAIAAIISPILVAIINNIHNTHIRKLELAYSLKEKSLATYYADKYSAYHKLLTEIGNFFSHNNNFSAYGLFTSALNTAFLMSNESSKKALSDFSNFVDNEILGASLSINVRQKFQTEFLKLSAILRADLESTISKATKL